MPARMLARCVCHDAGLALVIASATLIGQLLWPVMAAFAGLVLLVVSQPRSRRQRKGRCRHV